MSSVVGRINSIKQPRGGYIKPSELEVVDFDDGIVLNENENLHGNTIGLVVDYLTRFVTGTDVVDSFSASLKGSIFAEKFGKKGSVETAKGFLKCIKGLDDDSIVNSCKLVAFDVWFRNPFGAMLSRSYEDINPDKATIQNIIVLVNRSVAFFDTYGKVIKDGFTFEPVIKDKKKYEDMMQTGKGSYGGYTSTVNSGDGDFITEDTLWDFKVIKTKPTNKHTLQLLMYWIMGMHSGQEIYKNIKRLGIFNPRLNKAYTLDVSKISEDIISTVEREVICYD